MTILDEIIAYKKIEIRTRIEHVPLGKLEKGKYFERETLPLTDFLLDSRKTGIIAEFKKKSPSKGIINDKAVPEKVTKGYSEAGASGLSILTDSKYFGGSTDDLVKSRVANHIPILRKDFTIDEYQVIEAKSIGADVILLIAACLSKPGALQLAKTAKSINLQVILEVHDEKELNHLNEYIDIVGVNNRDLKSFEVNINTSINIAKHVPSDFLKISESGINSPETIRKLQNHGFNGFLIGENFMKENDPAKAFKEFVREIRAC